MSIALPFAFHTWCFPFALICHWISIVFLLYGRRIPTHSSDPSLPHFLDEDWLWYKGDQISLTPFRDGIRTFSLDILQHLHESPGHSSRTVPKDIYHPRSPLTHFTN